MCAGSARSWSSREENLPRRACFRARFFQKLPAEAGRKALEPDEKANPGGRKTAGVFLCPGFRGGAG